jgi:hypothetical protein
MKKIAIAMVILLALGSFAFGETVVGGEFEFEFSLLDNNVSDNWHDAEISVKSDVDDFNSIAIELDYEAGNAPEVLVDNAKLTTDISGALGLEGFTLSTTVGLFDTWFTNWSFGSDGEIEYAPAYTFGGTDTYLVQVDAGVDAVGAHFVAPVDGSRMLLGADFSAAGANGWLWYDMNMVAETSVVGGEADYALEDLGAAFYTSFQYGLDSEYYRLGLGATYGMGILSTAVAFSMDSADVMNAEVDLTIDPTEAASLFSYTSIALTDGAPDVIAAAVVGASYKFGAAKVSVEADVMADDISPMMTVGIFF